MRALRWTRWVAAGMALAAAARAEPARTTVAVDFTKLDNGELESQVLVRLVQEGLAVVAAPAAADLILSAEVTDQGLVLKARTGERETTHAVAREEMRDAVAQQAIELVREALAPAPPPALPPPAAPPAPPPELTPPEPPSPRRLSVSLGASALWRSEVDPLVALGFRWGRRYGFDLQAEVSVTPSVGPGISVDELGVVGGVGYRWPLRRGVDLDVGARVGLLAQYYALTDANAAQPSGEVSAFLFEVPVAFLSWISPRTALSLTATPGVASQRVTHTDAGDVLWSRSAFRLGLGMAVQHVF